jgi:predicted  nucleic acid-binding Zn-ribbon protein
MNREDYKTAYENVMLANKMLEQEIEKLKEDLEYSNHCEEQMRKTITNLEYKTTTLEEETKELKQRLEVEIDISNGMLKTIDKAIEFIYENAYDEEREICIDDLWGEIPKLLDILKGSEKE